MTLVIDKLEERDEKDLGVLMYEIQRHTDAACTAWSQNRAGLKLTLRCIADLCKLGSQLYERTDGDMRRLRESEAKVEDAPVPNATAEDSPPTP